MKKFEAMAREIEIEYRIHDTDGDYSEYRKASILLFDHAELTFEFLNTLNRRMLEVLAPFWHSLSFLSFRDTGKTRPVKWSSHTDADDDETQKEYDEAMQRGFVCMIVEKQT